MRGGVFFSCLPLPSLLSFSDTTENSKKGWRAVGGGRRAAGGGSDGIFCCISLSHVWMGESILSIALKGISREEGGGGEWKTQ